MPHPIRGRLSLHPIRVSVAYRTQSPTSQHPTSTEINLSSHSSPPQGDKVPQPSPRFLCNSTIIHSLKQNFLPKRFFCAILDKHLGADGCWCALWSSKPVIAVSSCIGGFNSHTFPPDKKSKGPQTIFVCGPFIVLPFSYRTIRWRHIPVRPQCGQVSLRRVRVW